MPPTSDYPPADPLGTTTPTPGADVTGSPMPGADAPASDSTDDDMAKVLQLVQEQQDAIAQLQRDLATRGPVANPSATVSGTAPAGGPTPAAFAGGAPAHAMLTDAGDVEHGDVVRYNVAAANGGDPLSGYGLVIDVVDVPDRDDAGNTQDSTHQEFVVARLDVLGVRLRAGQIVDEDRSAQVQGQLDRAPANG